MTASVYPEHILAPIVRYLKSDPVLQELGRTVPEGAINPVLGPPLNVFDNGRLVNYSGDSDLWVFRTEESGNPHANVEGTGCSSISLHHSRDWSRRQKGSSKFFPEISITYHADVDRDIDTGHPTAKDSSIRKIQALNNRVSRLLDATHFQWDRGWFLMGEPNDHKPLRVIDSSPGQSLAIFHPGDGDGMAIGTTAFEVEALIY